MKRMQIQLTEAQARQLRRLTARRNQSIAQLIRIAVDALLVRPEAIGDPESVRGRALGVIGRFRSGTGDLATAHDRHLADAFRP